MRTIDLYCLPFAGGSKYSYVNAMAGAPPYLKVIPLEYPGRGARIHETPLTDMDAIIDDLYQIMRGQVDQRPYAIYGHSMGGITAFLLAQKLIAAGHRTPLHLFITGTTGPTAATWGEQKRHLMEKGAFLEEMRVLDGMPEEVLADTELFDFFEPILRADFRVTETFRYKPTGLPLNLPFTVITGTEEKMTDNDIRLWQEETVATVDFRKLPGKHFFIFKHPEKILSAITEKLYPLLNV